MTHTEQYLSETVEIASKLDINAIEAMVCELASLRNRGGRLFVLGLGGSAANASHAVNDFRKLCNIEAYAPTDNVAELTARINDNGWITSLRDWMMPYAKNQDAILILSVGGGRTDVPVPVSAPIVTAITWSLEIGMHVLGIVGKDGGITKKWGHRVIIIPTIEASRVTPHTEGWQSVILHCIVSHPDLQKNPTKW